MSNILIFTDGSCNPNPGRGANGFVVIENDTMLHEYVEVHQKTTNNRMEMMAVLNALRYIQMESPIGIISILCDSQYVVKGLNEWRHGWKRKNWKDVKNVELWQELSCVADEMSHVRFFWVKGHAGNKWNEYIDVLISKA